MKEAVKILHVVNLKSFGGIQKLALELADEINKESNTFSNDLLSISGIDLFKDRVPKTLKVLNSDEGNPFSKFFGIIKKMNNYDIIHFHGPYTVFQLAALFVRRKFVYTEHGTLQRSNIKNNLKHFIQKRLVGLSFVKWKVDAVIFISPWLKEELPSIEHKSFFVNNGIKYIESKAKKKNDEIIISIAGRLISKKRVDLAIDVMHRLKDHHNIKLHIIGDGNELDDLKVKAGGLLDKTVYFLGYRPDAYDLIAASHFYLMTTYKEPFGLVVLEAMMSNSIVLSLKDSGGPVEFLGDTFPELIFDTVDDMANAVLKYSNDKNLMENTRIKLKEEYLSNYTISTMAKNYEKVYSECLKS